MSNTQIAIDAVKQLFIADEEIQKLKTGICLMHKYICDELSQQYVRGLVYENTEAWKFAKSVVDSNDISKNTYKVNTEYTFERAEIRTLQNVCDGDNELFLNLLAELVGKLTTERDLYKDKICELQPNPQNNEE